jgi:hypothetical protein
LSTILQKAEVIMLWILKCYFCTDFGLDLSGRVAVGGWLDFMAFPGGIDGACCGGKP